MKSIVINADFGGFSLSQKAKDRLLELGLSKEEIDSYWEIKRDNKNLVQIVEELGENAGGKFSHLKIVEIPDNIEWDIEEFDGNEWVSEKHQIWR